METVYEIAKQLYSGTVLVRVCQGIKYKIGFGGILSYRCSIRLLFWIVELGTYNHF